MSANIAQIKRWIERTKARSSQPEPNKSFDTKINVEYKHPNPDIDTYPEIK